MKICIDDNVAKRYHLSAEEIGLLIACKEGVNIPLLIQKMIANDMLIQDMFGGYRISKYWNEQLQKVFLESDKEVPKEDDMYALVCALRSIYPKGTKVGSSLWRGNQREITLKLQKFFKIYGNKYSFDEIIAATKKYVDSFNGNYTYMRILKYFIMKDEKKMGEDGKMYVEQVSELANFLENDVDEHPNDIMELR